MEPKKKVQELLMKLDMGDTSYIVDDRQSLNEIAECVLQPDLVNFLVLLCFGNVLLSETNPIVAASLGCHFNSQPLVSQEAS